MRIIHVELDRTEEVLDPLIVYDRSINEVFIFATSYNLSRDCNLFIIFEPWRALSWIRIVECYGNGGFVYACLTTPVDQFL